MSALAYAPDLGTFDLQRTGAELPIGNDIATAVIIALFSDRRAGNDDALPDNASHRRGWWADSYTDAGPIGSRLWLIGREKTRPEVAQRAREYAREALQWLLDDSHAQDIDITAELQRPDRLALVVAIALTDREETAGPDSDSIRTIGGLDVALTIRLHSRAHAAVHRLSTI